LHESIDSERDFMDFVENAAEGLHRVGADGTILWANKAELQMLGYGWSEYVGRHIAEFHADAHVIEDILVRLLAGETLYDYPARLRCKNGAIKHVLIHSNGYFVDGHLRYTRCFTRDATERRERDAALAQRDRMLLNAPVAAALLTGPDFTFRLANRRYCELLGRCGIEGQPFLHAFPELRGSEALQLIEQVWHSGELAQAEEMRMLLRDATGVPHERFLKFTLEPLAVEEGGERGVIVVAVDVTEHVRNRQELERAHAERTELLAELTAASRAKDEFLAMLGHELRNPLSPIVTALQLMRMRAEPAALREREIIERQVEHLVRLVDDLMDVSRVTRGKIDMKFERVPVARPLGKAVEMASPLLEQRRHQLEVEIDPALVWEGDPMRLAQVVANLLTNAARYTPPGGHVRLRASREGVDWLRIAVRDDGIGMDPALRAQVFELFFQGKRSIDRAEGGLGIGLALVKNIVELHEGRVEARSEGKGRGSEFVVLLPLRAAGASLAPAPAAPLAAPVTARQPHHGGGRQRRRRRHAGAPAGRARPRSARVPRAGWRAGRGAGLPSRRGRARHRPAGAGRLRAGAPPARPAGRPSAAPDRADRLRPGSRQGQERGRRFRAAPGEADQSRPGRAPGRRRPGGRRSGGRRSGGAVK
jgi:PAS domain S-box-containing protein